MMVVIRKGDAPCFTAVYLRVMFAKVLARMGSDRGRFFVDWIPVAVLTVTTQFSAWVSPITADEVPEPAYLASLCFLSITVPLGFRRRAPILALTMVAVGISWEIVRLQPGQQGSFESFLAVNLAAYAAGAYSPSSLALLAGLLIPGAIPLADSLRRATAPGGDNILSEIIPFWVWAAVACALGRGVRNRSVMLSLLEDRTHRLAREREERARAAVADERSRIARDLHDVVAHNVSIMVVQAGAARRVLDSDPERTREALLSVEATGRQALAEMRRLLGVLRADPDSLALAPQPGAGQIGDLVEQVRAAGLDVALQREGEPRELPAGVDLVAYRVVQEGLTNILKHAGHARALVTIRYEPETMNLEIRDDGVGRVGRTDGSGHGLFGMRERLALYGGTLEAGPSDAGGFVVRATLPTGPRP